MKLLPRSQGQPELRRVSIFLRATLRALTVVGLPILVLAPFDGQRDRSAPLPCTRRGLGFGLRLRSWKRDHASKRCLSRLRQRPLPARNASERRPRPVREGTSSGPPTPHAHPGAVATMQRDGNFVIYQAAGRSGARGRAGTAGATTTAPSGRREHRALHAGPGALGDAHVEPGHRGRVVPTAVREALRRPRLCLQPSRPRSASPYRLGSRSRATTFAGGQPATVARHPDQRFCRRPRGPVVQPGVHAGLSSRRSRVQIPSGPRSGSSVGRARA